MKWQTIPSNPYIFYTAFTSDDNLLGQIEWLRTHKDPYEEVKEKWDATHEVRLAQIRHNVGNVSDYFMEYGALQLETGYQLVSFIILVWCVEYMCAV